MGTTRIVLPEGYQGQNLFAKKSDDSVGAEAKTPLNGSMKTPEMVAQKALLQEYRYFIIEANKHANSLPERIKNDLRRLVEGARKLSFETLLDIEEQARFDITELLGVKTLPERVAKMLKSAQDKFFEYKKAFATKDPAPGSVSPFKL